jgi:hypothetical protein
MNLGRAENTGNLSLNDLLRPPEPEAVGSNPALPIFKSFLDLDLLVSRAPAGGAGVVTV